MNAPRRLPDWAVDPAAPAVPDDDPDDEDARRLEEHAPPARTSAPAVLEARRFVAEARTMKTRYILAQHRAHRLAALCGVQTPPPPPPPAPPKRKGGHPGHRARNDRLLALYEATPGHLPKATRCHLAAAELARAVAVEAGTPNAHVRPLPTATARDAIAEALRRRDAGAMPRDELAAPGLFTDEQPAPR